MNTNETSKYDDHTKKLNIICRFIRVFQLLNIKKAYGIERSLVFHSDAFALMNYWQKIKVKTLP